MRTYDLRILQPGSPSQVALRPSLQRIAGIDKLVQRWTKALLTITGSAVADPAYGCGFLSQILSGSADDSEVRRAFELAKDEVAALLLTITPEAAPDDERLAKVTLDSGQLVDGNRVTLTVTLTSEAGASRAVLVPLG